MATLKPSTQTIIDWRDAVDNEIYACVTSIMRTAAQFNRMKSIPTVEWDMAFIGEVRDEIIEYIREKTGLTELQVYP